MNRSRRILAGVVVAMVLLGAVPATVLAANPACGDTLLVSTTLTGDLDCSGYSGTALTLGADGITLDLGGFTITGPAGDDNFVGIYSEFNAVTITNGTVQSYDIGVDVEHSKNPTISWMHVIGEVADPNEYGIYVAYSAAPVLTHNTVDGNAHEGFYLYGNGSASLSWNESTGDDDAYYFEYDTNDVISHNTAHGSYGFYNDYSGGQKYLNNTASNLTNDGFYMDCDDYGQVTMIGNVANHNGGDGIYTSYCYIDPPGKARFSLISGNTTNWNGSNGIEDYYSVGATFTHNTAKHNTTDGLYFDYPGDMRITWNVARGNGYAGIELGDSYGTGYGVPRSVRYNTLRANAYGVYADYAVTDGVCLGNYIVKNTTANTVSIRCV